MTLDRSQEPGPLRADPPLGRGNVERSPLPGHGVSADDDRYGERTIQVPLNAAVLVVASIVVGQLWALTVALDAWFAGDEAAARWILLFQAVSFAIAVAVWLATPRTR